MGGLGGLAQGLTPAGVAGQHIRPCAGADSKAERTGTAPMDHTVVFVLTVPWAR